MKTPVFSAAVLTLAVLSSLAGPLASAFPQQRDREPDVAEVIVTGMRVTQGGAKDVNYLRGAVAQSRIPHPETFTAEGLISEHDVVIASAKPCAQVFCLTADSIDADLLTQPQARHLIGLGFATNIERQRWRRRPLNLVAVVDKSGSMSGAPLELVRHSLLEIVDQLRDGDRLSVVLYGDQAHVHLEPVDISDERRAAVRERIAQIESAGSTAMELGLRLGYETARSSGRHFDGITRVMLFTDEQPNVGNTHADGFMALARAASHQGIGLTTIGVGVQFDAKLATTISSVRGGNLFFMRDELDVQQVFRGELDYMVSELAHDLTLSITPQPGYDVAGVYGVPDGLLGWQDERTVKVTLPTVFLSSKGGALFVSLAKSQQAAHLPARPRAEGAPLASIQLQYTPVGAELAESDRIEAFAPPPRPSAAMLLGHALIDEFTVLHRALTAHHIENDQQLAYQLLHALATRLHDGNIDQLDQERLLVDSLEERFAFLAGRTGEPRQRYSATARLWGLWEVRSIQGKSALRLAERLEFAPDAQFRHYRKDATGHVLEGESEYGANRRQIHVADLDLIFDYEVRGNNLVLSAGGNLVFLQRRRHE